MLGHLLKVYYKNSFSFKRLFGFDIRTSKTKAILIGVSLIYGIVVTLGLFGWMFFDLGKFLKDMDQINILLSFLGVFLIVLPVILTLFLASGSLFYYKDYDIVGHLPIKSSTIFLAKLIVMLTILYTVALISVLPIIFSYFYWGGLDILSLILVIALGLILPLIPIGIFSLISLGIALITSKLRFGKILYIIFLFVFFLGFMFLMFQFNESTVNPLTGQIELFSGLANIYLPLKWFINAISQHDGLSILYLLGSHLILFLAMIYGEGKLAEITNKRGMRSITHHKKGQAKLQQTDIIITLVKKEFRRLISGVNYALNTLFGVVIVVVLSVASLFFGEEISSFLSVEMGGLVTGELIVALLIGFSIAMTTTPSVSLSLEGENLWMIKSLPIAPHKIMYAKVLMNLIMLVPMIFVGTILFGISSQISLMNQLSMMLMFSTFGIAISFMYAYINLLLPKFKFSNEVEVVKQSISVLIAIFAGFTMLALNGVMYWYVLSELDMALAFLILGLVNGVIAIPFWWIVRYQSEKFFLKYQG